MKKKNEIDYDKNVDFYWSNLINSLKLFSYSRIELESLIEPAFDPIFELESEIDYAFTPILFETIYRNNLIDNDSKSELLNFKQKTDEIPSQIWDWEFLDVEKKWIEVRKSANELLNKLGITDRKYNEKYTTVFDINGIVIKRRKNCS